MKKTTKLGIVASGIVLGLSAFAPLTTYAASGTSTVTVTVDPTITLDSITNASVTASPTAVKDTTFNARVITNKKYTISLTATNTALSASGTTDTIPASSTLTAGTNGWGVKKKGSNTTSNTSNDTNYSAITSTLNAASVFYTAASGTVAEGVTTTFTVGVAISSTLTAGSYSTQLTVTAVNN